MTEPTDIRQVRIPTVAVGLMLSVAVIVGTVTWSSARLVARIDHLEATVWIPNYANTANFKQILIQAGKENASTGTAEWELRMIAGLWSATSAITDVGIHVNGGLDIAEFSTFTLYGVTGA